MKRRHSVLIAILALLVLSACGGSATAGTWTAREDASFDFDTAIGLSGEAGTLVPEGFDPAVIDDPHHDYHPNGWLDENTVLCTRTPADDFQGARELAAVTLEGVVTVMDADITAYSMATAQDGVVIYGTYYETILPHSVTFARWDGTEKLTPIHRFTDGTALAFQQFFSPNGSKAVMSWTPEVPGTDWKVRIIDLETGDFQDLTPPEISSEKPIVLFSRWLDDAILLVSAWDMTPDGYAAAWKYSLPQ